MIKRTLIEGQCFVRCRYCRRWFSRSLWPAGEHAAHCLRPACARAAIDYRQELRGVLPPEP